MIVVLGAAGKTGRAIIRELAERGHAVRALVRRPEQQEQVLAGGAHEAVVADLYDAPALTAALHGAHAAYHLSPNVNPQEVELGQLVIAAAQAVGLPHLVYHSVLHPQTEDMPHHWLKLRVEEALFKSGLSFTILQPAAYMQNLLAGWEAIKAEGAYRVPYAVATALSLVDLRDVAEAAARALTDPAYANATLELVGTPGLSQDDVAATLAEALGKPVRAEAVDRAEWARNAQARGLPDYARETLLKMFVYYEQHGLVGSPLALTALLGRPPRSLAAFARDAAAGRL